MKKLCYKCSSYKVPILKKKKSSGGSVFLACADCGCFVFWSG